MIKLIITASLILSGIMTSQTVAAAEYYIQLITNGSTPLYVINPKNITAPANGKDRVIHAFIATNTEAEPVTVTITKQFNTSPTDSTEKRVVFIVPAKSTHEISLPSGIYLHRNSAKVYDTLQAELSTAGNTPSVDLTVDYKDE